MATPRSSEFTRLVSGQYGMVTLASDWFPPTNLQNMVWPHNSSSPMKALGTQLEEFFIRYEDPCQGCHYETYEVDGAEVLLIGPLIDTRGDQLTYMYEFLQDHHQEVPFRFAVVGVREPLYDFIVDMFRGRNLIVRPEPDSILGVALASGSRTHSAPSYVPKNQSGPVYYVEIPL